MQSGLSVFIAGFIFADTNTKPMTMKKLLFFSTLLTVLLLCQTAFSQSVWIGQTSGTGMNLNSVDFFNEQIGVAVGDTGTILRTVDGGTTWLIETSETSNNLNGVCYVDSLHIFIVGDGGMMIKTKNGGVSWDTLTVPGVATDLLSVDILPDGHGIACGRWQTILWTDDGGNNWRTLRIDWFGTYYAAQMLDSETGYVFGENSIHNHLIGKITQPDDVMDFTYFYVNVDGILTEGKIMDGYYFNNDSSVTVGPIFPGNAVITQNQPWGNTESGYVYFNEGNYLTGLDFNGNYGVAVGGEYNGSTPLIVESTDGGSTWTNVPEFSDKAGMNRQIKLIGNTGYIVGDEGKILKKDSSTGIAESHKVTMPVTVYPNPAGDFVNLEFNTSGNQIVTIRIADVKGQVMLQQTIQVQSAGVQKVTLPVEALSPGCYFYHIVSANNAASGKILIW